MSSRILVVYASRHGSTAEIAQAVGKELEIAGKTVDILKMSETSDVMAYDAVVIGAPVYMDSIDHEVIKFVARSREGLENKPVAAFVTGMSVVHNPPGMEERMLQKLHKSLDPVRPVTMAVFAGKLDPSQLSFFWKTMIGFLKVPAGDFRDWTAIAAWARKLPAALRV